MAVAPRKNRLDVRVDPRREALIRHAADVQGRTLTDFILGAASAEAERVLADRRLFALDDSAWKKFEAALDRPPVEKPRLRALLENPSILEI